eukprot:GDKH01001314.1.p2 GENE.GDKH01001314.1~~GDKH01001314.1.p2  ORF type:complete len:59 (-),score=0.32 GDKH01001314.1:159-335(-)
MQQQLTSTSQATISERENQETVVVIHVILEKTKSQNEQISIIISRFSLNQYYCLTVKR